MLKDLASFQFTDESDRAKSLNGWQVLSGQTVSTGAGADKVIGVNGRFGINRMGIGIKVDIGATLDTGNGSDVILGLVTPGAGFQSKSIINDGTIKTGNGSDSILGINRDGFVGLRNTSLIDTSGSDGKSDDDNIMGISKGLDSDGLFNTRSIITGAGSDAIIGIGTDVGIEQSVLFGTAFLPRTIDTGAGDDKIVGKAEGDGSNGIVNDGDWGKNAPAVITTGSGSDSINGHGANAGINNFGANSTISTGSGDDIITGRADADGIVNSGTITTGKGSDTITGLTSNSLFGRGIFNSGLIKTGDGNDTVDALQGGFAGDGTMHLGAGNDNLKGFPADPTGTFFGGGGTDTLTFNPGTYTITDQGGGFYLIGGLMTVKGFEAFGDGANETNFFKAADDGFVIFS